LIKKYFDISTFLSLGFYLLLSLGIFLILQKNHSDDKVAEIYHSGKLIYRQTLNRATRFTLKQLGDDIVFEIKDGKIRILQNTCPKKICVQMGWIDQPYESIICVPKKIVIRIRSNQKHKIQVTTG
jgi:hypothetical protein